MKLVHKFCSRVCYLESHEWKILKGKGSKGTIVYLEPIMYYILHGLSHLIFIKTLHGGY